MSDDLKQILENLKQGYLANLPAKIELLETLWKQSDLELLETEFHKLKGTGKTYGLPEISDVGLCGEYLCLAAPEPRDQGIRLALTLIRKIMTTRLDGKAFDLESSPDYAELRRLHDTYSPKD